eukprot:TRINITY_DN17456_c0_g1_i1.p1 TRINITY_DN17456_c0_g1~~TRINITY_DN17456_c0_g1_i1.p1  ORF type:complete len:244 (+),score=9.23 TRINITY_DN17456_c0_g1_i1:39-734(+)
MADVEGTGCGCGYPEYTCDGVAARSDRIVERLRAEVRLNGDVKTWLQSLTLYKLLEISGGRVGIVHGDPESLSGWNFSAEMMPVTTNSDLRDMLNCSVPRTPLPLISQWFESANVSAFVSSHTCLPHATSLPPGPVLNNGSAGLPNFTSRLEGTAARVAHKSHPPPASIIPIATLHTPQLRLDLIPVRFPYEEWVRHFETVWPVGSDGYLSYHDRIVNGPRYRVDQAVMAV